MINKITNSEFDRVLSSRFNSGCILTKEQKQSCQCRLETDLNREDLESESLRELNTIGDRDDDIEYYIMCEFECSE